MPYYGQYGSGPVLLENQKNPLTGWSCAKGLIWALEFDIYALDECRYIPLFLQSIFSYSQNHFCFAYFPFSKILNGVQALLSDLLSLHLDSRPLENHYTLSIKNV